MKYLLVQWTPKKDKAIELNSQLALVLLEEGVEFKHTFFKKEARKRLPEDYEPVITAISPIDGKNLQSTMADVLMFQFGFKMTFKDGSIIVQDVEE